MFDTCNYIGLDCVQDMHIFSNLITPHMVTQQNNGNANTIIQRGVLQHKHKNDVLCQILQDFFACLNFVEYFLLYKFCRRLVAFFPSIFKYFLLFQFCQILVVISILSNTFSFFQFCQILFAFSILSNTFCLLVSEGKLCCHIRWCKLVPSRICGLFH